MKLIVAAIDPRHSRIVAAMTSRQDELLPKTAAVSKDKPLVVMETRRVECFGCR